MKGRQNRFGWGLAIVAIVAALGGTAYFGSQHISAQGPGGQGGPGHFGGPGGPGGPGRGGRGGPGGPEGVLGPLMLNRLDLTEAQRGQVKQILDSHREEQQGIGQRARAAHDALESAIVNTPLDEAAIRGKASEVAAIDADLAVARGRVVNEVLQVLSSDQQSKLKELQAQQKQRMEQRGQRQGQSQK